MVRPQLREALVNKLPVIATAREAIKLPLIHWREFVRLAAIPIAVNVILQSLYAWTGASLYQALSAILLELALLIVVVIVLTSFKVAWIRLVVNGVDTVAQRNPWTFGRVERQFMAGEALLGLVAVMPFLAALGLALALRNHPATMVTLMLLAAVLLMAGLGCGIRLSFILIELALQRYRGWRGSWNQTRGMIWQLTALAILASLPFFIGQAICEGIQEEVPNHIGWLFLLIILQSIFTGLSSAATTGGLALAYRFTAPEP